MLRHLRRLFPGHPDSSLGTRREPTTNQVAPERRDHIRDIATALPVEVNGNVGSLVSGNCSGGERPQESAGEVSKANIGRLVGRGTTPRVSTVETAVGRNPAGQDDSSPPTLMMDRPDVVAALAAFDAGDVAASRAILERSLSNGPLDRLGRELLDLILPRVGVSEIVERVLSANQDQDQDQDQDELTLLERTHWLARHFDECVAAGGTARDEALDLLAAATLADEPGWVLVRSPQRWAAIEGAFATPAERMDLLEQESLAPPATGIPATVVGRAQAFAQERLRSGDLACAREAERLLHLNGHRDIAYQLEAERKRIAHSRRHDRPRPRPNAAGRRIQVVLAGGHPALRRLAETDLDQLDLASVRAFPSSWEGNRQERHARDAISGADLAIVIWRQISHSTSDQVVAAANALSVPVVRADTPTISSIRRAVESFTTDPMPAT